MNNSLATAESVLLKPAALDFAVFDKALAAAVSKGANYADVFCEYSRSESWSIDEGIVKSGSFAIDQGFGIRAVTGEKTAFAYSDEISAAGMIEAAGTVRAISQANASATQTLKTRVPHQMLYAAADPLLSLSDEAKVSLLRKVDQLARARDPRVAQVIASLSGEWSVVMVARSDGHLAADVRPLVRLSVQVIVEQNGRREQGRSGGGGRLDYAMFTDAVINDYVKLAVDMALLNLDARPAPAGAMPVVLGPGWPGVLLHEAVGHGLEGDFNRKETSAFAGRIGERVASPGVTVVDDGTLKDRRGSLTMDDEGNPTSCTTLIEDGILVGYIQDSLNARLMGVPVTGNGRRESFAHLPMPRMTNTYMRAGSCDPNEIIASVKDGIYAVNFGGGQVDITSGKFVFSMDEAYRIENGKVTYPLKGATLIGSGADALTRISLIGNDLALDSGIGVCGKEGQSVPVGVGQPTLRIDGLTIGGTG